MKRIDLFLAASLGLLAAGCSSGDAKVPVPDAATTADSGPAADTALLGAESVRIAGLRVASVRRTEWRDEWVLPGRLTLDPNTTQTLGAIVEGRVNRVLVLPGDAVRAGEVLVTLHSHEMLDAIGARAVADAALARTGSELGLAASTAARAERLYQLRAASLADLERARAALADARAVQAGARAERDRAHEMVAHLVGSGPVPAGVEAHEVLVRSPIDGVVITREAQPGQVATIGAPLLTVSRATNLALVLSVPESAAGAVRAGDAVHFSVQGHPDREWSARVTRVAPALDALSRTLEVVASVVDSTGALRPEMYASARLAAPAAGTALTVPAAAVQALNGDTVLIVSEQRGEGLHIRAAPVRIGRRTPISAEVLAGVDERDQVVVTGAAIARAEILRRRESRSELR
jgi:cobalt-zinc-cadmium efflux system membrane fusion protein